MSVRAAGPASPEFRDETRHHGRPRPAPIPDIAYVKTAKELTHTEPVLLVQGGAGAPDEGFAPLAGRLADEGYAPNSDHAQAYLAVYCAGRGSWCGRTRCCVGTVT